MLNKEQARLLASEKVKEIENFSRIPLCLMDDKTIEFEFGWMFFYQSLEYVKTGDLNKIVGGNAPIIVDKLTGLIILTGTGKNSKYYLDAYCLYRTDLEKYKEVISK